MSERPAWLEVGELVAIVGGYQRESITIKRVERFTKTRVVLAGGDWFPVDTLRRTFGGTRGHSLTLADPNDPRIVRSLRVKQAQTLANQTYEAVRALAANASDADMSKAGDLAQRLARKLGASFTSASDRSKP